jgi:hypothetical protein
MRLRYLFDPEKSGVEPRHLSALLLIIAASLLTLWGALDVRALFLDRSEMLEPFSEAGLDAGQFAPSSWAYVRRGAWSVGPALLAAGVAGLAIVRRRGHGVAWAALVLAAVLKIVPALVLGLVWTVF